MLKGMRDLFIKWVGAFIRTHHILKTKVQK